MPPGLIGSELSATPPQYLKTSMEESALFPPIARKSVISIGSDSDPNDFCNPSDRKNQTRGSVPASLASTPLKFPTIDRANSTSIASLPGSRSTRNRSITRDLRSSYCRSPSCPSNLNMRRDFNQMEGNIFSRKESLENLNDSVKKDVSGREDKGTLLPSIFSKDFNSARDKSKGTARRDRSKDAPNALTLRRSESFMQSVNQFGEPTGAFSSRDVEQRQGQAAALLLPIRNTSQTNSNNKKKKKRKNRMSSESDGELTETTPRNTLRYNRTCEDALEVIARETDMYDENDIDTPKAIEINSSRKVKQWIQNNQHSHSESEIKA